MFRDPPTSVAHESQLMADRAEAPTDLARLSRRHARGRAGPERSARSRNISRRRVICGLRSTGICGRARGRSFVTSARPEPAGSRHARSLIGCVPTIPRNPSCRSARERHYAPVLSGSAADVEDTGFDERRDRAWKSVGTTCRRVLGSAGRRRSELFHNRLRRSTRVASDCSPCRRPSTSRR